MDVAVIGAAGTCGRQLTMQLLEREVLLPSARLQLVTRRGGSSENELLGIRADLRDAFDDWAPHMEVVFDPADVDADIVVMMAGATVSADPNTEQDRAGLAATNASVFRSYAEVLARRTNPPVVVVQSNPVELAVATFAEHLGPQRVLGAGAWSDSLRFAREIATDLGVSRRDVLGVMLGQHGDYLVPIWSQLSVRGVDDATLRDYRERNRPPGTLHLMPEQVRQARAEMLADVRAGRVEAAFEAVNRLPVDVRAAVKPFFTHFTAGRTTEAVTARAATDIVAALVRGSASVFPCQVEVSGNWADQNELSGVLGVPVITGPHGWATIVPVLMDDEERAAMHAAQAGITQMIATAG